jgi:RND family efflux transporter MFP subunit
MILRTPRARPPRWLTSSLAMAGLAAGIVVLMMWLVGTFGPKVGRVAQGDRERGRPIDGAMIAEVVRRTIPLEETAVGTVQPVHRVEVASRLLARAVEVNVAAGQRVAKDDVLVRLEDTDLRARLAQCESAVAQAQAALDQARTEEFRLRAAFERNAVAELEMDRAANALKGAQATLARSQQAQTEARTVLEYATIRSPISGVIVDKRVSDGDTVSPGQVVVSVLDPSHMQLVASVRESLSRRLTVGGAVSVKLDALEHAGTGTVAEIVPESESTSRTFQVKVRGPCPPGVRSGMFGRLLIPNGEETVLLVPRAAVRSVGQVDCVEVAVDGWRQRRALRLGRAMNDGIEVLSGLTAGDKVVVDAGQPVARGR